MKRRILDLFSALIALTMLIPITLANANSDCLIDIELAADSFFVIAPNGDLVAWGNNMHQLISKDSSPEIPFANRQVLLSGITQVSAGDFCVLAIDDNKVLHGWGQNVYHQLLDWSPDANGPKALMDDVVSASVGNRHCVAITSNGDLYVWGENSLGQLGLSNECESVTTPQKLLENMSSTYIFGDISFAKSQAGDLYTWGGSFAVPTYLTSNVETVALMHGESFQILLTDGQTIVYDMKSPNTMLPLEVGVKQICDMGYIKEDGTLWMWDNFDTVNSAQEIAKGIQLAEASPSSYYVFVDLKGVLHIKSTTSGNEQSYAVTQISPQCTLSVFLPACVILCFCITALLCLIYRKRRKANRQQ